MYKNKKIVVILPAYNAYSTLKKTYSEIPFDIVDEVVLVDDASVDQTVNLAKELKIDHIIEFEHNKGYGANQKICYEKALSIKADIVVMLHPDYQYTPKLITAMISIIGNDLYSVVFGSRILGKHALKGGMPFYKYLANRLLTFIQNLLLNEKLSEYHTGFRAYSIDVLKQISLNKNSDDFIFDNQVIAQIFGKGFEICEITCPTKYFMDASSITFRRSVIYGSGVLYVSFRYFLNRLKLLKWDILD